MSVAAMLASLLGLASPQWEPADAPPPTVWAQAGARGWGVCREAEARARGVLAGRSGASAGNPLSVWSERAQRCPHAPVVLVVAARAALEDTMTVGPGRSADFPLDKAVVEHRELVRKALRWLRRADAEIRRRGSAPPEGTAFLRARVLLALGRVPEARFALEAAAAAEDTPRWRTDRLGALIELSAGNLRRAVTLAHSGLRDAPNEDRAASRYTLAYVLDRAGASGFALAELRDIGRRGRDSDARAEVLSVLPMHERLYLRALDSLASGDSTTAKSFFEKYLTRPEVDPPERELAARHLWEIENIRR